jgi:hypothetical protein
MVYIEYELAAERYFGADQGTHWCDMLREILGLKMCRIAVQPAPTFDSETSSSRVALTIRRARPDSSLTATLAD